jgi:hypothetical protein
MSEVGIALDSRSVSILNNKWHESEQTYDHVDTSDQGMQTYAKIYIPTCNNLKNKLVTKSHTESRTGADLPLL